MNRSRVLEVSEEKARVDRNFNRAINVSTATTLLAFPIYVASFIFSVDFGGRDVNLNGPSTEYVEKSRSWLDYAKTPLPAIGAAGLGGLVSIAAGSYKLRKLREMGFDRWK
jgi:hypothetical protein